MPSALIARLVEATTTTLAGREAELDRLDEALGDGDHGRNLVRGLEAFKADPGPADAALPAVLRQLAAQMRETMGGEGGAAYAALLEGMASVAPKSDPGLDDVAPMLDAAIAELRRRMDVDTGMKTMLDVLAPLAERLRAAIADGHSDGLDDLAISVVGHALHRTSYLEARRGLAARLGSRSVGHIDPGACSAALMVGAVVGALTR